MKFLMQKTKESIQGGRSLKRRTRFLLLLLAFGLTLSSSFAWSEVVYDSGSRRNPFIPLVSDTGALKGGNRVSSGEYKVEGIIFDPKEGSFALINGRFYKAGDQVDNAQLISILKDRVVLSVNDSEKVVWLREERADHQ